MPPKRKATTAKVVAPKAQPAEVEKPKPAKGKKTTSSTSEPEKAKATSTENVEVPQKRTRKATAAAAEAVPAEVVPAKQKNKTDTDYKDISFKCTKKNEKGQLPNFKIASWNVDGIRAWLKKGGLEYLTQEDPDVLCLQETKCDEDKLPDEVKSIDGYHCYWFEGKKSGYSGVGLITKKEPISFKLGIGHEQLDDEGRCITAEYEDFYVVTTYVPNAGNKLVTLPKRLEWNDVFKTYVNKLDKKKPVILCGDMNVAHNEIDLANPKTNKKHAGFTQEERDGMTEFLGEGYVDTYRHFYPDKEDAYTFWTYLRNARAKNVGWRLDYFIVSKRILDCVCDSVIREEIFGSDHCPIVLYINI